MNDMDVVLWLRTLLEGPRTLAATMGVTYDSIKVKLLAVADELEMLRAENLALKTEIKEAKFHFCEQSVEGHRWDLCEANENHGWRYYKCRFCEHESEIPH